MRINLSIPVAAKALLILGLCVPFSAFSHHGSNANPELYLAENLLRLEGEVSTVFWRNPHPRIMIMVEGESGEEVEWELELAGSVNGYASQGIDANFLQIGDKVKAAGVVSRRDPTSIGLLNLLLPSGEEMANNNYELLWSTDRFTAARQAPSAEAVRAAEASADGIFRTWGRRVGGRPDPAGYAGLLTDYGKELASQFYAPRDNPELECRSGIPTNMFDPTPMEITNLGDSIRIRTEEYDIVRTIYLTEDRPDPEASNVGYSIGHWEGDSLVVETDHIDWQYFDPYGTPQSDQMSYVETFWVAEDDSQLNYRIVATDPLMLTDPIVLERAWLWQPGTRWKSFLIVQLK